MTIFSSETIILYAKSFFGEWTNATLRFEQDGRVLFEDEFENGILKIRIPEQLRPGIYDLVASREDQEYRINSYMVPLATHYFKHAQIHSDLSLTGASLKDGEKLPSTMFDPSFISSVSKVPSTLESSLKKITQQSGNSGAVLWGGTISLLSAVRSIKILAGEILLDGDIYSWPEEIISIPNDFGTHYVGLKDNDVLFAPQSELDFVFGRVFVDGDDFVRLVLSLKYHSIARDGKNYFFVGYEKQSSQVEVTLTGTERLAGMVTTRGVLGAAYTARLVNSCSTHIPDSYVGPLFRTSHLYVYAVPDFVLLFDLRSGSSALLTALMRAEDCDVSLHWDLAGVSMRVWSSGGDTVFRDKFPYPPSGVILRDGPTIKIVESVLTTTSNSLDEQFPFGYTNSTGAGGQLVFE